MYPSSKSQECEEYKLTFPEGLVKDKWKGKIWLLELCVKLTCVLFYLIFMILSVFNKIIMLLLYMFLKLLCIPTE